MHRALNIFNFDHRIRRRRCAVTHLESLNISVEALAVIPHGLEAQHVAVVLDESGPPAVVHSVAQRRLCEDLHVVLQASTHKERLAVQE